MTIPTIKTLKQLQAILNTGPGYAGYLSLIKAIHLLPQEYADKLVFSTSSSHRISLLKEADYEVLLMAWLPGQESAIHLNSGQQSWVKVLHGELHLEAYKLHRDKKSMIKSNELTLVKEEISYLAESGGYHKLINRSQEKAVSMHLFVPPVSKWEAFDHGRASMRAIRAGL